MQSGRVAAQGEIGTISLDRRLRAMIDPDSVGAVVDGTVVGRELTGGLLRVRIGSGELQVNAASPPGTTLRVQLLARDIIVATQKPEFLSVRNHLKGVVTAVEDDGTSDLISIDVGSSGDGGGATILARITKAATRELALAPAKPVWALVKSVALRGVTSAGFPHE
jgi:molybdate transport system ATP-binding protein